MEGNRRNFIKKSSNPQFKKKGTSRKGMWQNVTHEQNVETYEASDTVYRILFQSKKIGSIIGKGGIVIKSLREETQAKIKVADSVPGSDERVVIISSPSNKEARKKKNDEEGTEKEDGILQLHCAAQDALLRVHDRVVEDDLTMAGIENGEGTDVTVRLLVPNSLVGCLLGRKGDVIQKLRTDTGASIRVLPAEHLSACALSNDELVQIQGDPIVAKKALYEVSTMLFQNPRKDRTPISIPVSYNTQPFHRTGRGHMENMHHPSLDPMWSQHNSPNMPWGGPTYDIPPPQMNGDVPSEFTMKILCPIGKMGGIIGKGGFLVKQLELETGASIRVEDGSPDSDEGVISVSSMEVLLNPRSQTIDAILQLQNRTSEFSDKGILTTRLLISSSKVGCLIGQKGQVINEMRSRTQAEIRVFNKKEKPKCASDNEELVQISGSIGVAKEALAEIASRLRTRCLRDPDVKADPTPIRSGFGHVPPPGTSGRFDLVKRAGPGDYDRSSYPGPSNVMGYSNFNSMEEEIYKNAVGARSGRVGANFNEMDERRVRPLNVGPSNYQSYQVSGVQNNNNIYNPQQGIVYETHNPQQSGTYQIHNNPQQGGVVYNNPQIHGGAYNPQQSAYDPHNPQTGGAAYSTHAPPPPSAAYQTHIPPPPGPTYPTQNPPPPGPIYQTQTTQQVVYPVVQTTQQSGAYPTISPTYQDPNSQQPSHISY